MKKILVTGVGGPAGRSLMTLLHDHGHMVVGVDMLAPYAGDMRSYRVPAATAPGFLDAVRSIAADEGVDLIIPTVSEELPVFADGWVRGTEIPVLVSPGEAVKTADDKYLTALALQRKGVPAPRFVLPSRLRSAEELGDAVGWPCISKPRVGRGGRGVILRREDDWPAVAGLGDAYILQEFAPGTDFAANLHVGRDGTEIVVVLEKVELKQGIVGNAVKVQRVDVADVADVAASAARAVGLVGPLDIDVRRRVDGAPVVLEINARFGANIQHAPEVLHAALADLGFAPC